MKAESLNPSDICYCKGQSINACKNINSFTVNPMELSEMYRVGCPDCGPLISDPWNRQTQSWSGELRRSDRQTGSGRQTETHRDSQAAMAAPHVSWKKPFNHVSAAVGGSEQQMPRHPMAINPPAAPEPAALSPRHLHGEERREHTDKVKVGRRRGGWLLHPRASPSDSPRRPSVSLLASSLQTAGGAAGFFRLHNVSTLSLSESVCV